MDTSRIEAFLEVPENRRRAVIALGGVIALSLLLLVARSCHRPAAESRAGYLARLADSAPERRVDAVLGLARLESHAAAPRLAAMLDTDPDEQVRRAAAYALLTLDRPALVERLTAGEEAIRLLAFETIARGEQASAAAYLARGLAEDDSARVRLACLELLRRFGGPGQTRPLLQAAENEDETAALRIAAIDALAADGDPAAAGPLQRLARQEQDRSVREAARQAAAAFQ